MRHFQQSILSADYRRARNLLEQARVAVDDMRPFAGDSAEVKAEIHAATTAMNKALDRLSQDLPQLRDRALQERLVEIQDTVAEMLDFARSVRF